MSCRDYEKNIASAQLCYLAPHVSLFTVIAELGTRVLVFFGILSKIRKNIASAQLCYLAPHVSFFTVYSLLLFTFALNSVLNIAELGTRVLVFGILSKIRKKISQVPSSAI